MQLFCEHWPNTIRYLYFFFILPPYNPSIEMAWFFFIIAIFFTLCQRIHTVQQLFSVHKMKWMRYRWMWVCLCVLLLLFSGISMYSILKLIVFQSLNCLLFCYFVCFCSCRTEQPQWKIFDLISLFIHFVTFAFLSSLSKCFYYNYYFTSLFYKM